MGNRILAACTAMLYSQISGRKLIIDWRDGSYSQEGQNSFPAFFEHPEANSREDLPVGASVYPAVWQGNLETSLGRLRRAQEVSDRSLSFDLDRLDYEEEILVFCAYTHKIYAMRSLFKDDFAYLSALDNHEILRSILGSQLRLNSDLLQSIEDFKSSHFGAKTIGVHVRYTDMKIPLDQLISKTQKIVRKTKADCIFLATDAQETIQQFQEHFERVVTLPKWFPPPGERLHQNWDHCPDRIQNGKEALMDIYLLAACPDLIFSSQSSFGFVASLCSKAEPQHLHDINRPAVLDRLKRKLLSWR